MHRVPFVLAVLLTVSLPSTAPAQTRPGPLPTRDSASIQSATVQAGTGRIRGRVISADTRTPLRRAQVTIFAAEVSIRRFVTTDAEGRYDFTELPASRYTINASKGGYVTLEYGQRRPFEPGTPVALANGQDLTQIDIVLPRGSVIAGRVTDEFGEPIAGAIIQVQRYQYRPGGPRSSPARSTPPKHRASSSAWARRRRCRSRCRRRRWRGSSARSSTPKASRWRAPISWSPAARAAAS